MESRLPLIVRSTEIDFNKHVNNTKYLEYLEWGREDFYELADFPYDYLLSLGVITVMVNVNLNYRKEALYNDELIVVTRPMHVGRTSFAVGQTILRERDDAVIADAVVTLVTMDPATRKSVSVPEPFRKLFADNASGK